MPGPDEDRGKQLVTTYVVGCAASLIFVALRLWCRISTHAVAVDDWCMLVTAVRPHNHFFVVERCSTVRHFSSLARSGFVSTVSNEGLIQELS